MTEQKLLDTVLAAGARKAVLIDGEQIVLSAHFRDMCVSNQCGVYGKCWMCPPAVGEIEPLMEKVREFPRGVWYQTVGSLEDSFDIDGMHRAKKEHNALSRHIEELLSEATDVQRLHLTCGGCGVCETCTMPEGKPCRFPELALPSLEAYGVDVYNTTKETPLLYINGQNTVTYFGLLLFRLPEERG